MRRLAGLVRALVGDGPEPVHGDPRPGDVRHSVADLTAAHAALGYAPRVDLETGLARALEYYRALGG